MTARESPAAPRPISACVATDLVAAASMTGSSEDADHAPGPVPTTRTRMLWAFRGLDPQQASEVVVAHDGRCSALDVASVDAAFAFIE